MVLFSSCRDAHRILIYGQRVKSDGLGIMDGEKQKELLGQSNSLKLNGHTGKKDRVG
jgi:hypothetical protein